MTFINKLRLYGFKSFANPTEVPLGNGFNCVMGPNGSGKTNLSDAICFVLGRLSAKSMRAEKTANLIFNGAKKGSAMREAEVSIFFDNSKKEFPIDAREVKVTRIVRQNGNSIYKVNDETMTRQQILELLARAKIDPDGHNIVSQGEIVHFMEMHTEERRKIIEDIAGISIYEDKKHQALLELDKVDSKVSEANIILNERESSLKNLKKERDQALKFKELEEKIKDNKATFYHLQIKDKEERKNKLDGWIKNNENEINKLNMKINELTNEISNKKEEIKNIEHDIEVKGEEERVKLRGEIEKLKTNIARDEERLNQLNNEVTRTKERNLQLKGSLKEIEKTINELEKRKAELNGESKKISENEEKILSEISKFKEKHGIIDVNFENQLLEIEKEIEKKQDDILKLQEEKNKKFVEKGEIEFKINSVEDRLSFKNLSKEEANILKNLKEELKKLNNEIEKIIDKNKILFLQLNKSREILSRNNEELERLRLKEISGKEVLLNDNAVKKILNAKIKGVYGTIAELGEAESKYSMALEIAAGARIKSIVVDDDKIATDCIKLLKESKSGVAAFLPLNKIKAIDSKAIKGEGSYGLAVDLIKFDNKFENVFSYVFGNTLIIEDDEAARRIGIGRARMVTLDGNLFESSGAIVGGYRARNIGSFKETGIENKIESLGKEIGRLRKEILESENERIENEDKLTELRNKKYSSEGEIIKIEKSFGIINLDELKRERNELDEKSKDVNKFLDKIEEQFNKFNRELEDSKKERDGIRNNLLKNTATGLDKLKEEQFRLRENISRISIEIKNIDSNISNIHVAEKEKILQILREQEKELENFQKEYIELDKKVKEDKGILRKEEINEKRFQEDYKGLFVKKEKINYEIQKREELIKEHELKMKDFEKTIQNISIDKAQVTAGLEALQIEFENWKDGKILRGVSLEELSNEIKKFEKMKSEIGSVNMRALEIYEGIEKEYNELVGKADKLKVEKEDVLKMMQEIEGKKKDVFMKTFNVIKENFERIFISLTSKGTAHLILENEEDPLNGGIDITVKIAMNKYLDIRSLSGGEKTLAALALIFAIQEYQPASFYLLDEVDAALDKTNSDLLSKLIGKYSASAQYILISHNDQVITEAEQVYGVSMQQNGISKIMSLKFDDNK